MYSRPNPAWTAAFTKLQKVVCLISIDDLAKRQECIERAKALTEEERNALLGWQDLPGALDRGVLSDEELRALRCPCCERRNAWKELLDKQRAGDTKSNRFRALHYALLLSGVLEKKSGGGITESERIEDETSKILLYLKQGFDLSQLEPRGPWIGNNWFAIRPTFGERRAEEALWNWIEASTDDPDYWTALEVIEQRLQSECRPLPDVLRQWHEDVKEGKRKPPPKTTGGPRYANEVRDEWVAYAESVLWSLGMTVEDALDKIRRVIDPKESRTQRRSLADGHLSLETIRTASRNLPADVPRPWECWPPPRERTERRPKAKKKSLPRDRSVPREHHRKGLSLVELTRKFPDNETAERWFVETRWPNGVACPKCGSFNVQERPTRKPQPYRCRDCRKDFSVKTGTLMQSSKLGLQVWAVAFYLLATGTKGTSSMKLHRDLNITQKSAWHLARRIREAIKDRAPELLLDGPIEADETLISAFL